MTFRNIGPRVRPGPPALILAAVSETIERLRRSGMTRRQVRARRAVMDSLSRDEIGVFGRSPEVRPGSQFLVPSRPENQVGTNWVLVVSRSLAVLSGLATPLPAVQQLR